jgi:hypothetical protein
MVDGRHPNRLSWSAVERRQRAHAGSHDLADEILREIDDDERVPARARRALS